MWLPSKQSGPISCRARRDLRLVKVPKSKLIRLQSADPKNAGRCRRRRLFAFFWMSVDYEAGRCSTNDVIQLHRTSAKRSEVLIILSIPEWIVAFTCDCLSATFWDLKRLLWSIAEFFARIRHMDRYRLLHSKPLLLGAACAPQVLRCMLKFQWQSLQQPQRSGSNPSMANS